MGLVSHTSSVNLLILSQSVVSLRLHGIYEGLNTNYSFPFFQWQKLPKAPLLVHLSLQQNNVESLNGLEVLRKTTVQSLVLKGNPVELDPTYRQQ